MTQAKNKFRYVLLAFLLTGATSLLHAQPPGDPGDDPDPAPNQIPFDGGLSLVVAAGIAYAAKKGHDKRKQQKTSAEK